MAALDALLEQALELPDDERGKLALRLLRTLEPADGDDVGDAEWEAAWSKEIDRRMSDVDDESKLVDGDAVLADARSWLDSRRP